MTQFEKRITSGKFVRKLGIGGYECEACGFWAKTRAEIIEHQKTCEAIGYLEAGA